MQKLTRALALITGLLCLNLDAAWAQSRHPTISVCLVGRGELRPLSIYAVTINWNGYRWDASERVDIGIWDATGGVWPQLRENAYRGGRTPPQRQEVVVGDNSIYPLYFGLMKVRDRLARISDRACSSIHECSIPVDAEGLEEISGPVRIPVSAPGAAPPC